MADIAIILDNAGNDRYAQSAREFLTAPIMADRVRILLSNANQLQNIIKIRNEKSVGTSSNRDISIGNYVSAANKTNLIIDVPLDPSILLDGQTYFQTVLEANSEMYLLFYFDQVEIGDLLKK